MAASGRNTCIEMEPLASFCEREESPQRHSSRSHTRSLSWANLDPVTQPRFTSNLSSIYSISPLTTVFREFLARSSDRTNSQVPNSQHSQLNRTFSDSTLAEERLSVARDSFFPPDGQRLNSLSSGVSSASSDGLDTLRREEVIQDIVEEPTVVEISEGVRWLERNALFLVIIFIKFSVFHRAG